MSAPLLTASGLVKHFVVRRSVLGRPVSIVRAVDGVDFEVAAGETLALVGESGSGKSTIGRMALGLIEPTAGAVQFEGQDIATLDTLAQRRFRSHAQLIFQDPFASLNPRMTVGQTLAEPLALHTDLSRADRRNRVSQLLADVGLRADHADRFPHEFSGGQRQRIAIARALAPGPKLIVCDEPVSALDVSIRAQVLNLLADLQQRLGLAYIFISHDLAVVRHIASRVAVLYLGRIVETASVSELFTEPRHPYTQALLSAIPMPHAGPRATRLRLPGDPPSPLAPPSGCHLNPRCPHVVDACRSTRPELTALGDHATACHHWRDIVSSFGGVQEPPLPLHLARLINEFAADRRPTQS